MHTYTHLERSRYFLDYSVNRSDFFVTPQQYLLTLPHVAEPGDDCKRQRVSNASGTRGVSVGRGIPRIEKHSLPGGT